MADTLKYPAGFEHVEDFRPLESRLARVPTLAREELEGEYTAILGRKQGELNAMLKSIAGLSPSEKHVFGSLANRLRDAFEEAFEARRAELKQEQGARGQQGVDLTMPERERWTGALHPVTRVVEEIAEIFRELGFARVVGPEAETEWYNFTALNFPADHPAMDLHDTLYLETGDRRQHPQERRRGRTSGVNEDHERRRVDRRTEMGGKVLLRTHTSPVQIRTMLANQPPIRVIMPGLVYRKDAFDASHAPAFSQIEGLAVDEGIGFVDLKATLTHFAQRFFSAKTRVRFRPSYFPFTEPSAEMDVSCTLCGGSGCAACKQTGWMEILGSGMVHPKVLELCSIDPERYTGFAFGMGPHRIAMVRHGVPDIRLLYEGDMRFLSQFTEPIHSNRL
ncbi:MAG: phenylalanine--tRNA ligase subunit alpha [Gemmatimonadota bacterium]